MKKLLFVMILAVILGFSTATKAELVERPGGLIFDTDLGITWLKDGNLAKTLGDDPDGLMHWDQAAAWADDLVYAGHSNWRLPDALNDEGYPPPYLHPFPAYGDVGSEMGHLYHEELWDGSTYYHTSSQDLPILTTGDPFINLPYYGHPQEKLYSYWTGTMGPYPASVPPSDLPFYWYFAFHVGSTGTTSGSGNNKLVMAVHDGDIGAIPIPGAVWLLGSGLIGIVGIRRKFKE